MRELKSLKLFIVLTVQHYILLQPQTVTALKQSYLQARISPIVTERAYYLHYLAALQNYIVSKNLIAAYAVLSQFFPHTCGGLSHGLYPTKTRIS